MGQQMLQCVCVWEGGGQEFMREVRPYFLDLMLKTQERMKTCDDKLTQCPITSEMVWNKVRRSLLGTGGL